MKYHWDKKYLYWGVTIFFSVGSCIMLYYFLFKGADISTMWNRIINILMPIIDGLALAYILSELLNFIEKKILYPIAHKLKVKDNTKSAKVIRNIGVLFTMLIFVLILYSLIMMIVPQVLNSLQNIIKNVPIYFYNINQFLTKTLKDYPSVEQLFIDYWGDIESWSSKEIIPSIQKTISHMSTSVLGGVVDFLAATWDFIIGFIIAIYLLAQKEKFCAQSKKVIYAFLKPELANTFLNNLRFSNKTFGGFLSGKIVDSIIIGIICYVGMTFLKFPYALLISVIIGITNIIPFFGPYLGAVPSAIIILMVSPMQCVYFLIFILVLQQFDGNILGPKILGDSTGLSSFWVIFAITLFGGIFGILGMFIGVPLFAIIYATFKTVVNQKLRDKGFPDDTAFYLKSKLIIHDDGQDQSGKKIRISDKKIRVIKNSNHNKENIRDEQSNDNILDYKDDE